MKKISIFSFFTVCILLITAFTPSPPISPKCFNYQAVVRASNGAILPNQAVALRVSFAKDAQAPADYSERHIATTNQFGQIVLSLGCGVVISGNFDALDWGAHDFWVKIEIDPAGGSNYFPMSENKLLAVPYAAWAEHSGDWIVNGLDISRLDGNLGVGMIPLQSTKVAIRGSAIGMPFVNGNILDLNAIGAQGGLVFGKLNASGDSYIQSSRNGGPSRLHLNPEGGSSNSVTIRGSAIGMPFVNGNILDLNTTGAQGGLVFGKLNASGESYIQSSRDGGTSSLYLNPEGGSSNSVIIRGSSIGMPFVNGNILSLNVTGAQGGLVFGKLNASGDSYIQSSKDGGPSTLYLNPESPHARVVVPILEITGGDVAEARHGAGGALLLPGTVVVFDETEQGKVRPTDKPYDKKVAGVISGAGKYFAGVCLLRDELARGAAPVAQVGTVEVWCVGPVEVGDLLTTSAVPGHAMAIADPLRGIGATLGKAVTSLKAGEQGLVEMQVEKH